MTAAAHIHAEAAPAPAGGKLLTRVTVTLGALVALMLAVLAVRFVSGLGAVSNMSQGYPWGIWIAYDVVAGTALAGGGFTTAFLVYILNRGEYHPAIRPALLAGCLGYAQAGASVFFDIGRYWNCWHIFWPTYANVDSVLFEVALCIMAYCVVSMLEFSPVLFEGLGWARARRLMNRGLFLLVAIGVLLPTMHQSSLGTMLVVYQERLHPLYQTLLLPVLFLLSCIGMGVAAVVFEGCISAGALRRPPETVLLGKLLKIVQGVAAAFLVLRLADVLARGVLPLAFQLETRAVCFWIENALVALPLILLARRGAASRPAALFTAGVSMALAGILYRMDAYLVAYNPPPGWTYFPSAGEIAVSLGLVAFEILAIILAIRVLPVLPSARPEPTEV